MAVLGQETITIIRAPLIDSFRDGQYRDWDNAVETPVVRCNVQPFPLAEKLNFEDARDREFSRTSFRFYCPPGTDVEPTDRVRWKGREMDVFGSRGAWDRFSGVEHHVSFIARERLG